MEKRKSLTEQIDRFRELGNSSEAIDKKLDELIFLLESSDLDSDAVSQLQDKFNEAVEQTKISSDSLKLFRKLDNPEASRLELVDNLENLLSHYKLDSEVSKRFILVDKVIRLVKVLAGLVMIALGFAMIVMPATPAFEMYTIVYLTAEDGVTLMDLIALLIVFAGVYLFVTSVSKVGKSE
ncbi:hypothetical protein [Pedobacter sp. SYSU D00535]|uniref:hypothetical protein n=1 Tax=Pedobacter sp. SYSU D00535 TaxID=2810308 RepID=UPI001A975EC7|nr:hypothetical protein [Pedobacter sp. SYSU D00535]